MNPIHRLDRWLIDKPYQSIVDLTQRQPAWLVRQCALLTAVTTIMKFATLGGSAWVTALGMLALLAIAATTFVHPIFAALGGQFWARAVMLASFAFDAVLLVLALYVADRIPASLLGRIAVGVIIDALCASCYYFAACKPPRPRVPRTKLAGAGGAA